MKRLFLVAVIVALVAGKVLAAASSEEFYPDEFRWEKRLLIVYAPTEAAAKLEAHRKLWAGADAREIADRHLLVFEWKGADRLPGKARERYGIDPREFTVLLVGLDGGVKLVARDPVGPGMIFTTIDAMPMRQ